MSGKKANYSSVIDYMKDFLSSNNQKLMNCCYNVILGWKENRYHRMLIPVINDTDFDDLFPLVSSESVTENIIDCDFLNYYSRIIT